MASWLVATLPGGEMTGNLDLVIPSSRRTVWAKYPSGTSGFREKSRE